MPTLDNLAIAHCRQQSLSFTLSADSLEGGGCADAWLVSFAMATDLSASEGDGSAGAAGEAQRRAPLYALVANVLRTAITGGSLAPGAVILEGPVAEILGCTRTPVRQALNELAKERLVARFGGRGYAVGRRRTEVHRVVLTPELLGLPIGAGPVRKPRGWEAIQEAVERDVVHLSVFGRHRVNEIELARHFRVGRTVARDVLLRLEGLGLMEKDERQRWTVTPLDDQRISHLYELRWLLEPAALRAAAQAGSAPEAAEMADRLRVAIGIYPKVTSSDLDRLEHDLHVQLLARCPNKDLLHSLQRTRCVLTLSKHVLGVSAPMPRRDPFLAEHLSVLQAVAEGDQDRAERLLRTHLEGSCVKVMKRAKAVRSTYSTPDLPYVDDR